MELSFQEYQMIQKYLDGALAPDEVKLFLEELKHNKALEECLQFELELRLHLDLHSFSKDDLNMEKRFDEAPYIKSLIERAGNEWKQDNPGNFPSGAASIQGFSDTNIEKRISFPVWLRISAAACLVLAFIGIVWFVGRKAPSPAFTNVKRIDSMEEKIENKRESVIATPKDSLNKISVPYTTTDFTALYKKFYKKESIPEKMPEVLAAALVDYENENYAALQNFDLVKLPAMRDRSSGGINSEQNVKEFGHFYKGLAFLQTNNLSRASKDLLWVIDSAENSQLQVKATWYLALVSIKKGDIPKAIPLLNSVKRHGGYPYAGQAKELLQTLKP